MIVAILGTTGELIKIAPVLRRLQDEGEPAFIASTLQQATQISPMLADFGLRDYDLALANGRSGRDLETLKDLPFWLGTMARRCPASRRTLRAAFRSAPTRPLVLVHGDTMTTVLGSAIGRALRVPVAHIEAGLRSGDWRNPFPEELDRMMTSKLASLHYAPGPWAAGNLRDAGVSGEIVDTGFNTVRDALALVPPSDVNAELPHGRFGLVSIHRFELLGDRTKLEDALKILQEASRETPLLFIDHPVTIAALRDHGLDHYFDDRFRRVPRQRYFAFISLLKSSSFLVTDSGGSQEECTALGIPCLVHRATTERRDGLDDGPVVLSGHREDVLSTFLADPDAWRREPDHNATAPSAVIVDDLRARGHIGRG